MYFTYIHTKPDGTPFYVGKGSGPKRHKTKQGRNDIWKAAVLEHGYEATILAYWDTEKEAYNHEKLVISCLRDMGHQLLANKSNGGGGTSGYTWTEEQKANHYMKTEEGKKWLSERVAGDKNPMFGKKRPDVAKRNKEQVKLGKNHQNFKGTVIATNKTTGEQIALNGMTEQKAAGFCPAHISSCLTGKLKSHKNHTFKRVETI